MSTTTTDPVAPSVWLVRAGRDGEDEERSLSDGLAIIGFLEVGDLSQASTREAVQTAVQDAYPDASKNKVANFTGQLWAFCGRMQVGDIVALPLKTDPAKLAVGVVTGPYRYKVIGTETRHTRTVSWKRPEVLRSNVKQDMLYSLGAFMTVCRVQRHDAENRFAAILAGEPDPGAPVNEGEPGTAVVEEDTADTEAIDIAYLANTQVITFIQEHYKEHELARLVGAVMRAEGYQTNVSPPGPDGGVDILAGQGPLGLDSPRVCVQVKSSKSPVDVNVLRALMGTMQTFKAEQGLLVCWGGFTKPARAEARQSHFSVRLWSASDLVEAVYRNYERLPEDIQTELPLKRVWALVPDRSEQGG